MALARADIDITIGNDEPFIFELAGTDGVTETLIDLTGSVAVLGIDCGNGDTFELSSDDADSGVTINGPAGRVTWVPVLSDTRRLPPKWTPGTRPPRTRPTWELKIRFPSGEQRSYGAGYLNPEGGIPGD